MDVIIRDAQDVIGVLAATPAVQEFGEKFIAATRNQSLDSLELNYGAELVELYE